MSSMSNLSILQSKLKENKIDIFIINRSDEFLNEYISPYAERLKYVSNFSGSAGKAIVLQNEAFLYVDGRYTFQAKVQINKKEIKPKHLNAFWEDLKTYISKGKCKIAIDPKLHSINEVKKIQQYILNTSSNIKFLESNIIDSIWTNKPSIEFSKIFDHPLKYAGDDRIKKLNDFKKYLEAKKIDHYLVTGLDNIAWLLNIRGDDILFTPLVYAYLLISQNEKPSLFINQNKINEHLKSELKKNINIFSIDNIENIFSDINNGEFVGLDFSATTYYFLNFLEKKKYQI